MLYLLPLLVIEPLNRGKINEIKNEIVTGASIIFRKSRLTCLRLGL